MGSGFRWPRLAGRGCQADSGDRDGRRPGRTVGRATGVLAGRAGRRPVRQQRPRSTCPAADRPRARRLRGPRSGQV